MTSPRFTTPERAGVRAKDAVGTSERPPRSAPDPNRPGAGTNIPTARNPTFRPPPKPDPKVRPQPKYSAGPPAGTPGPTPQQIANMTLAELDQELEVESYLDEGASEQEHYIAQVADVLDVTYDQADALIMAGGDIIGMVMEAKAMGDIYNQSWADDGADIRDYHDLPDKILSRTGRSPKAVEMMRQVMAETPSKHMFAPLWPPLDSDGYQDVPRPVLKVDIRKKLRDPNGRNWSVRPMGPFRPEPTVPCPMTGCIKMVDSDASLIEHIEGKHKQRAEVHRKEQQLRLDRGRESRELEELELRKKDIELRERDVAAREKEAEIRVQEMRYRLNQLGIVTPQQDRDERQDDVAAQTAKAEVTAAKAAEAAKE
jgi:hypothetical protein